MVAIHPRLNRLSRNMENIFTLASSVATPLALGGLFAAILFFIFKQILSKNFIAKLTSTHSAEVVKRIIDCLFYLALTAMVLGFFAFVLSGMKPKVRENIVSGSGNTIINGSHNVVSVNSDLSLILQTKSKIIPVTVPSKKEGHEIFLFEFQEEIPSIQVRKINSLIRDTVWKIYKKNEFYRHVKISAKPMFFEYGLLGISINILLEEMDVEALLPGTPEKEAMFLLYMASAHPLEKATGLVINIANAEPYEFKDLFRSDAMPLVSMQMKAILRASEQYYPCEDQAKINDYERFDSLILEKYLGYPTNGCFFEARPNANFYLTPSAVVVKYSRYEIGPGMLGAPEVAIPFNSIGKFINPNGPLAFLDT